MKVAFRVDASVQIGAGHSARCLTLADELRAHGATCRFLCRHAPESLIRSIAAKGHELTLLGTGGDATRATSSSDYAAWLGVPQELDAEQALAALAAAPVDWLIVDHYALDRTWESKLRKRAARILVIDDLTNRAHDCDLLVNQNPTAADAYASIVPASCRVLGGPRYAMLRPEFRDAHARAERRSGVVRRLLVFFGGFDPINCTTAAIDAIVKLESPGLQTDVVIGAEHPDRQRIEERCKAHGLVLHVQTTRMAELMLGADLAVGAGGSANWERCCTGLPSLIVTVADNQRELVRESALAGVAYAPEMGPNDSHGYEQHLRALVGNPLLLSSMSYNGLNLVDGEGIRRVLHAMGFSRTAMRVATAADSRNLFEWRNDPGVRAMSRVAVPLEWSAHSAWLESVLADRDRVLLIGERSGEPVGVVRFDIHGERAEVSIYKVSERRERGVGAELLVAAENWLHAHRPDVRHLDAEVLGQNRTSHALFVNADYIFSAARYMKTVR